MIKSKLLSCYSYSKLIRYRFIKWKRRNNVDISMDDADVERAKQDIYSKIGTGRADLSSNRGMGECSVNLSIIIPVYRNGEWLEECLESVLRTDYRHSVEIILSSDGADEECRAVMDKYLSDDRVVLIDNDNFGLSHARNCAIDISRGEYILFIDSDDWVEIGAIDDMLDVAYDKHVDAVSGGFDVVDAKGAKRKSFCISDRTTTNEDIRHSFNGYAWGNIIKRNVFSNISFPEGLIYEDTIMSYLVATKCQTIIHFPQIVYHYRTNPRGICSTNKKSIRGIDSVWIVSQSLDKLVSEGTTIDERLHRQTLRQFGKLLYNRCEGLNELEKAKVFVICRAVYLKYFREKELTTKELSISETRNIFLQGDYYLWVAMCRI